MSDFSTLSPLSDAEIDAVAGGVIRRQPSTSIYQSANGGNAIGIGGNGGNGRSGADSGGNGGSITATGGDGGSNSIGADRGVAAAY